jgi:hypothetical protein
MASGVISPKPKSGSSRTLRKDALTAFRIWAVRAALAEAVVESNVGKSSVVVAEVNRDDTRSAFGSRRRSRMDWDNKRHADAR